MKIFEFAIISQDLLESKRFFSLKFISILEKKVSSIKNSKNYDGFVYRPIIVSDEFSSLRESCIRTSKKESLIYIFDTISYDEWIFNDYYFKLNIYIECLRQNVLKTNKLYISDEAREKWILSIDESKQILINQI